MSLRLKDGALLLDGGKAAEAAGCCCDTGPTCDLKFGQTPAGPYSYGVYLAATPIEADDARFRDPPRPCPYGLCPAGSVFSGVTIVAGYNVGWGYPSDPFAPDAPAYTYKLYKLVADVVSGVTTPRGTVGNIATYQLVGSFPPNSGRTFTVVSRALPDAPVECNDNAVISFGVEVLEGEAVVLTCFGPPVGQDKNRCTAGPPGGCRCGMTASASYAGGIISASFSAGCDPICFIPRWTITVAGGGFASGMGNNGAAEFELPLEPCQEVEVEFSWGCESPEGECGLNGVGRIVTVQAAALPDEECP